MKSSSIKEEFLQVQGVKTSVLKLGDLEESKPNGHPRVLMLIVPGNPGVSYYYEDFMQELYRHSKGQVPVWALGQAGHIRPADQALSVTDVVSTTEALYGLDAQVSHKLAFIQEHVPPDVALILIGHSIGCYMILNILEGLVPPRKVLRCFLLFPTIERMAESPNGRTMTPILRYLRWIVVFGAFFLFNLPMSIRTVLLKWYFRSLESYPDCLQKAVLETVTPWTANFASYLAKIEMNKVTVLQSSLVEKHLDKLSLYYGLTDGWTPIKYYEEFVAQFPKADARLCKLNLKHAFVLKRSDGQAMAEILWSWVQSLHLIS